ncbi:MAG: WHG domain-containing protein [Eubacteriales bacterium]|nr:WHG domain-containing protein [Eubacteriales bacterium]
MPPKTRITREMILNAAFEIARESGIENVNARTVSQRLGCSTQPVMYCFATIESLRAEVYKLADAYQTSFIMAPETVTMLDVGMAYVRFAAEEKYLFRLLFQSDHFSQQTLSDVVEDASIQPLIEALAQLYNISHDEARDAFIARFLMVHGMASMLANNSMVYDEATVKRLLEAQFDQDTEIQ